MKLRAVLLHINRLPLAHWGSLIDFLHKHSYRLVIVSQPPEPESVILQHLEQAGLPSNFYDFITGVETMRFSETNPAFYVQIIAQLGVEADESLLISTRNCPSLETSQTIGMPHLALDQSADELPLDAFERWHATAKSLNTPNLSWQSVQPHLQGNLGALQHLLSQTPVDYWRQRPDPQEWSVLQILTHLVQSEQHYQLPRLQQIMREDLPFISAPKPSGPDLAIEVPDALALLAQFELARQQTLDYLAQLPLEAWQRPARHSVFGLTTLLEMALFTARHDRLHIQQLCQTIGKCSEAD